MKDKEQFSNKLELILKNQLEKKPNEKNVNAVIRELKQNLAKKQKGQKGYASAFEKIKLQAENKVVSKKELKLILNNLQLKNSPLGEALSNNINKVCEPINEKVMDGEITFKEEKIGIDREDVSFLEYRIQAEISLENALTAISIKYENKQPLISSIIKAKPLLCCKKDIRFMEEDELQSIIEEQEKILTEVGEKTKIFKNRLTQGVTQEEVFEAFKPLIILAEIAQSEKSKVENQLFILKSREKFKKVSLTTGLHYANLTSTVIYVGFLLYNLTAKPKSNKTLFVVFSFFNILLGILNVFSPFIIEKLKLKITQLIFKNYFFCCLGLGKANFSDETETGADEFLKEIKFTEEEKQDLTRKLKKKLGREDFYTMAAISSATCSALYSIVCGIYKLLTGKDPNADPLITCLGLSINFILSATLGGLYTLATHPYRNSFITRQVGDIAIKSDLESEDEEEDYLHLEITMNTPKTGLSKGQCVAYLATAAAYAVVLGTVAAGTTVHFKEGTAWLNDKTAGYLAGISCVLGALGLNLVTASRALNEVFTQGELKRLVTKELGSTLVRTLLTAGYLVPYWLLLNRPETVWLKLDAVANSLIAATGSKIFTDCFKKNQVAEDLPLITENSQPSTGQKLFVASLTTVTASLMAAPIILFYSALEGALRCTPHTSLCIGNTLGRHSAAAFPALSMAVTIGAITIYAPYTVWRSLGEIAWSKRGRRNEFWHKVRGFDIFSGEVIVITVGALLACALSGNREAEMMQLAIKGILGSSTRTNTAGFILSLFSYGSRTLVNTFFLTLAATGVSAVIPKVVNKTRNFCSSVYGFLCGSKKKPNLTEDSIPFGDTNYANYGSLKNKERIRTNFNN